jgi:murein DD-endopeptidase MepM/ murein hydrolase activator NlpD
MKKYGKLLCLIIFLSLVAFPTFVYAQDATRPPDPPNRPTILKPYRDPAGEQHSGPGEGFHKDKANRNIKGYYAYDFIKFEDKTYQKFDVYSSAAGKVIHIIDKSYGSGTQEGCPINARPDENEIYGQGVIIDHGHGWQTFYFHLDSISVANGTTVAAGEKIGVAGCSGTDVVHLHYDLRWRDPDTKITWTYPIDFAYTPPTGAAPIDIAFVIDTTGSMGPYINATKLFAGHIIDLIDSATTNSRVAVVEYRDYPWRTGAAYDYPYLDVLHFTYDKEKAKNAILGLSLGYGGDLPETLNCVLMHTMYSGNCEQTWINTTIGPWRAIPTKIVIYLSDAPPLDPEPDTSYTSNYVIEKAKEGGFVLWGGES